MTSGYRATGRRAELAAGIVGSFGKGMHSRWLPVFSFELISFARSGAGAAAIDGPPVFRHGFCLAGFRHP